MRYQLLLIFSQEQQDVQDVIQDHPERELGFLLFCWIVLSRNQNHEKIQPYSTIPRLTSPPNEHVPVKVNLFLKESYSHPVDFGLEHSEMVLSEKKFPRLDPYWNTRWSKDTKA
jgi:hypothetical protein